MANSLLLVEVGGTITRRVGSSALGQQAIERVQKLPNLRLVEMSRRLMEHVQHLACELHLRGADTVYVAVADRLNVPLISWDSNHLERASKQILVYSPQTAP